MKFAVAILSLLSSSGALAGPIVQNYVNDLPGGARRFDYYITAPGDAGYFLFTLNVSPELTGGLTITQPVGWFALTPPDGGVFWLSFDPLYDIYPSSTGNFSLTGITGVGYISYTIDLFDPISGLAFDFVEGEVLGPVPLGPGTGGPGEGGGGGPEDPGSGGGGPIDGGGPGGGGTEPPPGLAEIPEPSSLLLAVSGTLLLTLRRRQGQNSK